MLNVSEAEMEEFDMGIVRCYDQYALRVFREVGCINCGGKDGVVKMYPHRGGHRVKVPYGVDGFYWIYFECDKCQYQSSLVKAENKVIGKVRDL